ncbi:hypothetical protein [Tsuneonella rigui]|jgi:hypothetical protein|uniref:hypothetical protein n=1 Tax=Tsuneonella rigui TaxID=1708790 RepID=UPI000F7D6244|nr:hypothetical protein [Tsuneonella rigui]
MRKKEEFESARLMDFEYRLRARTMRLLGDRLGRDGARYARETALRSDEAIVDLIAAETDRSREEIVSEHVRCATEARAQLIGERGDPTPYRLG